jgi:fructokinase
MTTEALRIGIDLGGTKIEAAVVKVDAHGASALSRERVPTERDEGYAHILEQCAEAVSLAKRVAGVTGAMPIGVGMPGSVTYRREDGSPSDVPLVKNSNTVCFNGKPFRDDLSSRLGTTVAFSNDANCFALAEACFGAAKGSRLTFGVIMGTGTGGGIVIRQRDRTQLVWDGLQGIGGEWGHVTLDPANGPLCYCGRRGCIEQYLSGPAIERRYRTLSHGAGGDAKGATLGLAQIAAARHTDAVAGRVLGETLESFGRSLATVINILDPDVIVLGGGVSNLDMFYDEGVKELGKWVFSDTVETPVVRAALGDSAGVFGAAMLEPDARLGRM